MHSHHKSGRGLAHLLVVIALFGVVVLLFKACGVGGFGPTNVVEATVTRLYVDTGKEASAYMVTTDKGVFEIDNGLMLGMWNADELYGPLKVGETYRFRTKGKRVVNMFAQHYPYIVAVEPVRRSLEP